MSEKKSAKKARGPKPITPREAIEWLRASQAIFDAAGEGKDRRPEQVADLIERMMVPPLKVLAPEARPIVTLDDTVELTDEVMRVSVQIAGLQGSFAVLGESRNRMKDALGRLLAKVQAATPPNAQALADYQDAGGRAKLVLKRESPTKRPPRGGRKSRR